MRIEVQLLDGTTVVTEDRKEIERLWLTNKISYAEATASLCTVLNIHPSNAYKVGGYLAEL